MFIDVAHLRGLVVCGGGGLPGLKVKACWFLIRGLPVFLILVHGIEIATEGGGERFAFAVVLHVNFDVSRWGCGGWAGVW